VVHITPENFHACVAAIRTFVEASYKGGDTTGSRLDLAAGRGRSSGRTTPRSSVKRSAKRNPPIRRIQSEPRNMDYDADEEEEDDLVVEYTHVTMQLLDLMHTLHSRAAGVHEAWAAEGGGHCGGEGDLWDTAWCPVLQGMARLCCDRRAEIRTQALTLLQRSLLIPDLQVLKPNQWEFCFLRVLFPMLRKLLEPTVGPGAMSAAGKEETKLRAAMMLSKVFLQHLGPLSSLPTFTALWLTILDFLAQFVSTASTDLLADALPESLKNMLLVMDTSGKQLFFSEDTGLPTSLWTVTWEKIDTFLPNLRAEVFGDLQTRAVNKSKQLAAAESQQAAVVPEQQQQVAAAPEQQQQVAAEMVETHDTDKTDDPYPAVFSPEATVPAEPAPNFSVEVDGQCSQPEKSAIQVEEKSAPIAKNSEENSSTLAGYFGGTVISDQPMSLIDAAGLTTHDRFPSLPVNLSGTTAGPTLSQSSAVGSPGLVSPVLASTAFSLPTSPSHVAQGASNVLFTPIVPAPGLTPASPIAAPTPVLPAATNPVIIPPSAVNTLLGPAAGGVTNTAFTPPANPLLASAATLPQFQTSVSPPKPSAEDIV